MNRKTSVAVAVSLACSVAAVQPARAQVFEVATGIAGGLVDGVLFGGELVVDQVMPAPTYHASPLPPPARYYAEEQSPACRSERVRAWNGYRWYFRRVEVCG